MAKQKKRKAKGKALVMRPVYRMKVERDRTKYDRKRRKGDEQGDGEGR